MLNGKKIVVIMPAYNAARTLEQTYREIPFPLTDAVILTDDRSNDNTVSLAQQLGIDHVLSHETNKGYGGNQKTCYRKALEIGADIVIMLHPDYQYTPLLIAPMATIIASDLYPVVIGSRILGSGALRGGMPLYKYISNRFLTFFQNLLTGNKLSEYHTGYRAYRREVLESINFEANDDDFIFDNEFLVQILFKGYEVAEITCPTKYFAEASSINFRRSLRYGLGVMRVSLWYWLAKRGIYTHPLFRQ
ncbi:MAG: glycosyltransferase family 2 protein [Sphingobacteriales bacterium]|nr:glycosyltransferase family 2 protein [Sphingobacteriales bacterium]